MKQPTFDSLECYELLRFPGVDDKQAKVQAEIFANFAENQNKIQIENLQDFKQAIDEKYQLSLAIKADLKETELKLQKEIEQVHLTLQKEIEQVRLKIEQAKYSMLKWQIGIGVVLAGIMAKGFNWLGYYSPG